MKADKTILLTFSPNRKSKRIGEAIASGITDGKFNSTDFT